MENRYRAVVTNITDPEKKGRVQIKVEGVIEGQNLPWAQVAHSPETSLTKGIGLKHHNLQIGSNVLVEAFDFHQTWLVTHCIPSDSDIGELEDTNNYEFTHPSGVKITMSDNKYQMSLPDGGSVTLTEDNKLEITSFSEVIINDKLICNESVECKKTVDVTGDLSVLGTSTLSPVIAQSAVIGGILFNAHTHICNAPGTPSGPPQ
jgi:hypothetical protein